jgi:hypothetical protein
VCVSVRVRERVSVFVCVCERELVFCVNYCFCLSVR